MNINKIILNTLKSIDVPVNFQVYEGTEETYITFFEYLQQAELCLDDKEKMTGHYIQIDIWSKNNYNDLVEKVKELLINQGFTRKTENDFYESDTKIYHKCIRFFYTNKINN